jgi:ATP-dependent Lon protease
LVDIPKNIKQNLDIKPVRWIDDVIEIALQHMPEPLPDDGGGEGVAPVAKGSKGKTIRAH